MSKKILSIVIPCYNEAKRIQTTINKVDEFMWELIKSGMYSDVIDDYEVVVVNDGSRDETDTIVKSIDSKRLKFISNSANRGKGSVIRDGFREAEGSIVLFMDADLATDISGIKKVLNVFREEIFCAVIGSRKHRQSHIVGEDKWYRNLMSFGLNLIARTMFPIGNIRDTQCGFKAYSAVYAKMIVEHQLMDRFSFDMEHILIVRENGGRVIEIPVHYYEQETTTVRAVRDTIRFMKDLVKIRKNYKQGLYKKHYKRKDIRWEN